MPAQSVLAEAEALKPPAGVDGGLMWGQQIVDGWVERSSLSDIYARKDQAPVPMIIGNNTREFPLDLPANEVGEIIRKTFGGRASEMLALYGLGESGSMTDDPVLGSAGTQFATDVGFRCPANWVTNHMHDAGLKVWRYQFGLPRAYTNGPSEHSAELRYIFETPPEGTTVAAWPPLQQYWANFARTGDPNGPGLPHWPELGQELSYIDFTPLGAVTGKDLRGAACRAVNSASDGQG